MIRHIASHLLSSARARWNPCRRVLTVAWLATLLLGTRAGAEDGYDLWLRYRPVEAPWAARYRAGTTQLSAPCQEEDAATRELARGLRGMTGSVPPTGPHVTRDGALLLGTPDCAPDIEKLRLPLETLGPEGYLLRSVLVGGHRATVIAANTPVGVLYGVFHFLRLMQTRSSIDALTVASTPRIRHRLLNHWDNLDGTVERGYAGASIWNWQTLPGYLEPRYTDYARACASVGINGSVLTNVNADAVTLTPAYLEKVAALAGVFRPYGIRVYLTPRFTAPMELGGLSTADPLDPEVRVWWQRKTAEIYRLIPDFGGFLVKANSEGQPGPQDYGRSHAEGANLFADALAPYGGKVIWRAFVYGGREDGDRSMQAFQDFVPLDGQFRNNAFLQVKNGPIDFQPREPPSPLFGAMVKTPVALELQITKEYLGFATHLVYLGPLYEEVLRFDTAARGAGSTVARAVDGTLWGHADSLISGVSNVGADRNWTGSHFDQANWFVFGRLAWDPEASSQRIADEWIRMTFSNRRAVVTSISRMMMGSREAAVDYMTPLGLAHLMAAGHHYGPGAWQGHTPPSDADPLYYHRANAAGIGFERGPSGSNAVAQYAPPLAAAFGRLDTTPEKYLLWFHHVAWDHRLASGRTLWEELALHYSQGVSAVAAMRRTWASLAPDIDTERYAEVTAFLAIQEKEARWWRDASLAYFQHMADRPYPTGVVPPEKSLIEYESIDVPYAPGSPGSTAAPFRH